MLILQFNRGFHFTKPALRTFELETYEELEQYLSDAPNSLAIFDFYDNSNGLSKMQSSRLRSKVESADTEVLVLVIIKRNKHVQVDLIRVDTVSSPELTDYFQIEVTPTLISFLNGEVFERVDGNSPDEEIEDVIQTLVEQAQQDV